MFCIFLVTFITICLILFVTTINCFLNFLFRLFIEKAQKYNSVLYIDLLFHNLAELIFLTLIFLWIFNDFMSIYLSMFYLSNISSIIFHLASYLPTYLPTSLPIIPSLSIHIHQQPLSWLFPYLSYNK